MGIIAAPTMYAWLISTSTRYGDRHDEPARAVSAQFDGLIAGDRRTGIGLLHLREDPYPVGEIDITQGIVNRSRGGNVRSEEHTSELQSLMRISYAVFCLKKKTQNTKTPQLNTSQSSTKRITSSTH